MSNAGLKCYGDDGNLTFTSGDGLARIVHTGYTGGVGTGQMLVPAWQEGGIRPWFTTVNFDALNSTYRGPGFYVELPYLKWIVDAIYPQGTANILCVCGIY